MRTHKLLIGALAGGMVLAGGIVLCGSAWATGEQTPTAGAAADGTTGRPILNFIRKHFKRAGELKSQLNLSDEQKTKIRQSIAGHKTELVQAFKDVQAKRQALRDAALAETATEESIRAAADNLGKAIGDAAVKASQVAGEVRKNLTPEQIAKIRKFRETQRTEVDKALDKALGE
jgi:Spy/CpxP family protein refolding chaperone